MRITLLSPRLPPEPCGVADYTARLAEELTLDGHEVSLWKEAALNPRARPDALILQFTPYLFGPKSRGICWSLPGKIRALARALGCPVGVMAHELHYPMGLSPDRLILGTTQFLQFLAIAHEADFVCFSYRHAYQRFSRLLPWRASRFQWLPVGANVLPAEGAPDRGLGFGPGTEVGIEMGDVVLLQFGSDHPSRVFSHSFAALERATRELAPKRVHLVFVGLRTERVRELAREAGFNVSNLSALGLGYLSPVEASYWLTRADLVLAPFIDGVSARRGSVMAALAHGRPVVSTQGWCTLPEDRAEFCDWSRITALSPASDSRAFASRVTALLKDPERSLLLAQAGRDKYEKLFSWPSISRRLLEHLRLQCIRKGEPSSSGETAA